MSNGETFSKMFIEYEESLSNEYVDKRVIKFLDGLCACCANICGSNIHTYILLLLLETEPTTRTEYMRFF